VEFEHYHLTFLGLPIDLLSTSARCLVIIFGAAVQYGRLLPLDAMLSVVHAVVVYLSICLSVYVFVCVCNTPVLCENG